MSLSNTDSLCWVRKTGLFFFFGAAGGGSIKFIFMGVYVPPKHIVVIYNRYSLVPSKTLNINVKRIYTNREKSQYCDNVSSWLQSASLYSNMLECFTQSHSFALVLALQHGRGQQAQWHLRLSSAALTKRLYGLRYRECHVAARHFPQ